MAENLVKGDASSVFLKRLAKMNNKYLEGFDETKARTYGLLVDTNNLDGIIMQRFPLPLSDSEIVDVELSSILKTANNSEVGFVLEVDLDYPDALHKMHGDSSGSNEEENWSQQLVRVWEGRIGSTRQ